MNFPEGDDLHMFRVREKLRDREQRERRFDWTILAIVAGLLLALAALIYSHSP